MVVTPTLPGSGNHTPTVQPRATVSRLSTSKPAADGGKWEAECRLEGTLWQVQVGCGWGHSPVHGELLCQQPPVIAPRVGCIKAVAYLLADGQWDLEGIGS